MPKAKARRKSNPARNNRKQVTSVANKNKAAHEDEKQVQSMRTVQAGGVLSMQSLLWPGMVTLGCWGMAFTFAVFTTDPNHLLYAGMAAIMALMWSISFGVRLRKIMYRRPLGPDMK